MKACFILILLIYVGFPLGANDLAKAKFPRLQQGKAQTTKSAKPTPNRSIMTKEPNAAQHRSILALKQLLTDTSSFTDEKLKIKAQVQIADLLWDYDKGLSKDIFMSTFKSIDELHIPIDQSPGQLSKQISVSRHFQLREEVLSVLTLRDYDLANSLRASIENKIDGSDKLNSQTTKTEQAILSLFLAKSLARSNPQQAALIVKDTFARGGEITGLPYILVALLIEMRQENPQIANGLFLDMLTFASNKAGALSETIGPLATYIMPGEEAVLYGKEFLLSPDLWYRAKSHKCNIDMK